MKAPLLSKTSRRNFLSQVSASLASAVLLPEKQLSAGSLSAVSFPWPPQADRRFTLCAGGDSAILVGGEDLAPAQYCASVLRELTGHTFTVQQEVDASSRPVVLIGDASREGKIRRLVGEARVQRLGPEGILLLTTRDGARPVLVVAGGSRAAVNYACGELLNFHVEASGGEVYTPALDLIDNPELSYRIFWNLDNGTDWLSGAYGEHIASIDYPYLKGREVYLADFNRCLDYMGEHKLNGLILWGFLRDSHGGVEAAKEIVAHSNQRGVRILPGVGTSYYSGIYFEGEHRFNLESWLGKHPELRLRIPKNLKEAFHLEQPDKCPAICPSKPQNQQWLRQGGEWLFTEFPELGGANLEHGDFLSCATEDCERERMKPGNDPNYYWDMLATQLPVIQAGETLLPNGWFTYATYTGFNPEQQWQVIDNEWKLTAYQDWPPRFVQKYPQKTICQWSLTEMVEGWGSEPEEQVRRKWPRGLRPPTEHSIGFLHPPGSPTWKPTSWWSQSPNSKSSGRHDDFSELIRYSCERCKAEGLEGLEILGEASSDSPLNELNYLAFEEFSWHPNHTMEEFVESRLSKVYGSTTEAKLFLHLLRSQESSGQGLQKHMQAALEASRGSQLNPRQKKRWENLAGEMARRLSLAL